MFLLIQKWHKKFGVFAALFVICIVISGVAINHSEQLELNKKFIKTEWLLDFYQINPATEPIAFNANGSWATQVGERVYFDNIEISKDVEKLVGIISNNETYTIAYDGQLKIITKDGGIIEHLTGAAGVPAGMKEIGQDENDDIVIKAAHGYYHVNINDLEWKEYGYLEAVWSVESVIPTKLYDDLLQQYRGSGLTIEKLLMDIHSGRFAGTWGIYFVDLIAILMLILSCTGVWMWWHRK
ncbi:PepSY domain-containing protein [Gammaproteobacteria bacterium]|mgnify:FL=1|jgi:hypothetical protein|nr:PepSY domain-containing protein [Gammaproteobacteria bacterium]|tara:strand:- start:342 stop:1061 length:720 start_codon:yes stop_codon:yes gene_type:complete